MARGHLAGLVLLLSVSLCAMVSPAVASENAVVKSGDPLIGLFIVLGFLFALVLFCYAYLFLDRAMQRKVDAMAGRKDIEGLIRALRSPFSGPKAARALGKTSDDRAVEPLMSALCDHREAVRKAAAAALGELGDERALGPLSRAAEDKYASVRGCAKWALGNIEKRKEPGAKS